MVRIKYFYVVEIGVFIHVLGNNSCPFGHLFNTFECIWLYFLGKSLCICVYPYIIDTINMSIVLWVHMHICLWKTLSNCKKNRVEVKKLPKKYMGLLRKGIHVQRLDWSFRKYINLLSLPLLWRVDEITSQVNHGQEKQGATKLTPTTRSRIQAR